MICLKCLKERTEIPTIIVGIKSFACKDCRELELQAFDIVDGEFIFVGIIGVFPTPEGILDNT